MREQPSLLTLSDWRQTHLPGASPRSDNNGRPHGGHAAERQLPECGALRHAATTTVPCDRLHGLRDTTDTTSCGGRRAFIASQRRA